MSFATNFHIYISLTCLLAFCINTLDKTSISFSLSKCKNTMPYVKLTGNKTMPTHDGISICFWMYIVDIGVSTVCSVATVDNPQSILVQIHPRLKVIRVKVLSDESTFYYQSPRRKWVHLCVLWFRTGDMNMYVNGKLYDVDVPVDYQVKTRSGLEGQRISVVLGEMQTKFDNSTFEDYKNFKGSLFDVKIFNRTTFRNDANLAKCEHLKGEVLDMSMKGWIKFCNIIGPLPPCSNK